MDKVGMTPRQKECLDYIRQHFSDHGYAPTYREMAEHLGVVSLNTVSRLIHGLRERGHIRMLRNQARAIMPVDDQ